MTEIIFSFSLICKRRSDMRSSAEERAIVGCKKKETYIFYFVYNCSFACTGTGKQKPFLFCASVDFIPVKSVGRVSRCREVVLNARAFISGSWDFLFHEKTASKCVRFFFHIYWYDLKRQKKVHLVHRLRLRVWFQQSAWVNGVRFWNITFSLVFDWCSPVQLNYLHN